MIAGARSRSAPNHGCCCGVAAGRHRQMHSEGPSTTGDRISLFSKFAFETATYLRVPITRHRMQLEGISIIGLYANCQQ